MLSMPMKASLWGTDCAMRPKRPRTDRARILLPLPQRAQGPEEANMKTLLATMAWVALSAPAWSQTSFSWSQGGSTVYVLPNPGSGTLPGYYREGQPLFMPTPPSWPPQTFLVPNGRDSERRAYQQGLRDGQRGRGPDALPRTAEESRRFWERRIQEERRNGSR